MVRQDDWTGLVAEAMSRSVDQPPQRRRTLEATVGLAVEIGHEGREGRRVGTLFVIGDVDRTLPRSRMLILDPLAGHDPSLRSVGDKNFRETLKELAQLDGAFIIDDDGTVLSAARFIDVDLSAANALPAGLGTRHAAALSISAQTDAVAVVVSESSVVRAFAGGELRAEIAPQLLGRPHPSFATANADVHDLSDVGLTVVLAR